MIEKIRQNEQERTAHKWVTTVSFLTNILYADVEVTQYLNQVLKCGIQLPSRMIKIIEEMF